MEALSSFLGGMRRERRLTLGQLALRAGVNKATLSRWEAGTHRPRVPELLRVLDALEASPSARSRGLGLLDAPRAVLVQRRDADAPALRLSVGDVLYGLRQRAGKSQAAVARAVGVSRSLVSQWENDGARPTDGQLHAAAFALGASAEEVALLSCRAFAQAPVENSREALLDRYADAPFWEPDATEASDGLFLLTLLGGFGRLLRAGRADPGDLALIVSNYAGHVEHWHNDLRGRDRCCRRALALAADAHEPLHFHLIASVRGLLDPKANPRPFRGRLADARDWQPRFRSNAGRAYLLSFLAGAVAPEAPDEALRLGDESCALVADDPDEGPCRRHDRANLLRKCGRPAESVAALAALTPQDTYRAGLIQMDMAQGLTDLGARAEAGRCLSAARTMLAGTEALFLQAGLAGMERDLA